MSAVQHGFGRSNAPSHRFAVIALVAALVAALTVATRVNAQSGAAAPHGAPPIRSMVVPADSARNLRSTPTGQVRSLMDSATATLARLESHVTTLAPGAEPHVPHRHAHEELLLVQHGTLEVLQGTSRRRAGAGSLIFQGSNELHGLRNIGADTATYLVIAFHPRDLAPDSTARRP